MILVVDASVAIKWFVTENLHEEARRLLDGGDELHAPDLIVAELANVAWKKAIRAEIADIQAKEIAAACLDGVPFLQPSVRFIERATEIALDLKHPVYDCLYVACAEALGEVLVTADTGLRHAVTGTGFDALVRSLEEIQESTSYAPKRSP